MVEVSSRQLFLDAGLTREQPVHGVVEVIFVGVAKVEHRGQCGGVPPARSGQLAVRLEDASGHHGHDQVAVP